MGSLNKLNRDKTRRTELLDIKLGVVETFDFCKESLK
jgi:hypothetical protein